MTSSSMLQESKQDYITGREAYKLRSSSAYAREMKSTGIFNEDVILKKYSERALGVISGASELQEQ